MRKISVTSIALAAVLGLSVSLSGAVAEEGLTPQQAYEKALNDCAQLDNPDRRQECREKAKQQFEQAEKSGMKDGGMEKQKRY